MGMRKELRCIQVVLQAQLPFRAGSYLPAKRNYWQRATGKVTKVHTARHDTQVGINVGTDTKERKPAKVVFKEHRDNAQVTTPGAGGTPLRQAASGP